MKEKILTLLLSLFILTSLSAQQRDHQREMMPKSIYFETHIFPKDSLYQCFILYKIPLNNLVFVKESDHFKSEIIVSMEVMQGEELIERIDDKRSIIINDYESTKSDKIFEEGLLDLVLSEGDYVFLPIVELGNTDIQFKQKPLKVEIDSSQISLPIIVYDNPADCNDNKFDRLVNFQSSIPFSEYNYKLIIPIYKEVDKLSIELLQEEEIIYKDLLQNPESEKITLGICKGLPVIKNNSDGVDTKLFTLDGFSSKLKEGKATLKISGNKIKNEFDFFVRWTDKPKSLYNTEFAIKILELIFSESDVNKLFDEPEEKYYESLVQFWKKYDRDSSTEYNEVMAEFYSRVDFVVTEFKSLNDDNGLMTDRGKIYVKYGKPDKVERSYNQQYQVLEIWKYTELNKEFVFADITGLGNFTLVN